MGTHQGIVAEARAVLQHRRLLPGALTSYTDFASHFSQLRSVNNNFPTCEMDDAGAIDRLVAEHFFETSKQDVHNCLATLCACLQPCWLSKRSGWLMCTCRNMEHALLL